MVKDTYASGSQVHELLLRQQLLLGLTVVGVVNATVHGAYGGALRLVMEARAFGAFVRHDKVHIHGHRRIVGIGIVAVACWQRLLPVKIRAVAELPLGTPLVYGVVRAFRLASSAIDTLLCDDDGHVRSGKFAPSQQQAHIFVAEWRKRYKSKDPVGNTGTTSTSMDLQQRLATFIQLGSTLSIFGAKAQWPGHSCGLTEQEFDAFEHAVQQARSYNGWFTEANVRFAASGNAHLLEPGAMEHWLSRYPALNVARTPRKVGVIMAGNIPFVGFHDLLCVLLAGHHAVVKTSSEDAGLTVALLKILSCIAPEMSNSVRVTNGKIGEIDAVIATGSDNTARYFEHYFGRIPRIVRKNRTSVAVLDGSETDLELAAFGEDVFRYFGLGCRNVGKVFIPQHFDLDRLFGAFFPWKDIVNHNKYANNYDYNKAVWLLDRAPIIENGFLILKEEPALNSPVAALYYERYADASALKGRLDELDSKLQCVVGHDRIPFGSGQFPGPGDYADNVDTLEFLLALDQGVYS